jgi:hypothetical protein
MAGGRKFSAPGSLLAFDRAPAFDFYALVTFINDRPSVVEFLACASSSSIRILREVSGGERPTGALGNTGALPHFNRGLQTIVCFRFSIPGTRVRKCRLPVPETPHGPGLQGVLLLYNSILQWHAATALRALHHGKPGRYRASARSGTTKRLQKFAAHELTSNAVGGSQWEETSCCPGPKFLEALFLTSRANDI